MVMPTTAMDIFARVKHRLTIEPPVQDFRTALQMVIEHIDRRLYYHRSDVLKADNAVELEAGESVVALPAGLLGIVAHPVVSYEGVQRQALAPLPEFLRYTFSENNVPRFYDVVGLAMAVYPTTDRALTVKFRSFNKSAAIEDLTSEIPYDGIFDSAIAELLIKLGANPLKAMTDAVVDALVTKMVDDVFLHKTPKDIRFRVTV
jgi:hypothetical protein